MGEAVPMRAPALKQMWGKRGGNDKSDGGSNKSISLGIRAVRARAVRPSARGGAPAPRMGAGTYVTSGIRCGGMGGEGARAELPELPRRPGDRTARTSMFGARRKAESAVGQAKRRLTARMPNDRALHASYHRASASMFGARRKAEVRLGTRSVALPHECRTTAPYMRDLIAAPRDKRGGAVLM